MSTTIGILGGGISGLSAAYHLARRLPASSPTKIVLLEKSKRLGGWIQSENATVETTSSSGSKTHSVVLEAGPRTLRPKSLDMLELVHLLGLESSLILIPHTHPASRNRFVHFPETGLTRLPSDLTSLALSQFVNRASLSGLLPSALGEIFKTPNRPAGATDESFDSFMSRRFGPEFARRFGSSLIHGIYAADSRKLSVRATFGQVWDAEERGSGSVVKGVLRGMHNKDKAPQSDFELGDIQKIMKGVSVFTFREGMQSISRALEHSLRKNPRVEIRTGEAVRSIQVSDVAGSVMVETNTGSISVSRLISTLPLPTLSDTISSSRVLPHLEHNPHTTVHVVNLVFPPSSTPIHPPGFGYLVPRPHNDYASADSPVLGCVFDSTVSSNSCPTVLTMMLGGPFPISAEPLPLSKILSLLASHLNLKSVPQPLIYRYHIQPNCIPTPLVGHLDRIAEMRQALDQSWNGRLQVIGSGVGGVSLGDCVRDGRRAAANVIRALNPASIS
ncbi:Protoporphyrinogen oxidase [Ceratobasidium sp. AG-I]|nr:Protoporphyrinogen oxidase [Ceratobasidium sp. AG-I]